MKVFFRLMDYTRRHLLKLNRSSVSAPLESVESEVTVETTVDHQIKDSS